MKKITILKPAKDAHNASQIGTYAFMLIPIIAVGLLFSGCQRDISSIDGDTKARMVKQAEDPNTGNIPIEKFKEVSGEVTIFKLEEKVVGDISFKIFHITAPADGDYYLSAWVNSPALDIQATRFMPLAITINNEKQNLPLNVYQPGWHGRAYVDAAGKKTSIKLKKDANTVAFSCTAPITPSVDFIRLTRDKNSSDIPKPATKP